MKWIKYWTNIQSDLYEGHDFFFNSLRIIHKQGRVSLIAFKIREEKGH